jgi:hypothetical protein
MTTISYLGWKQNKSKILYLSDFEFFFLKLPKYSYTFFNVDISPGDGRELYKRKYKLVHVLNNG